jgi:peptidyl-tRNA hydrolase, PTH1 family
MIGLGNPGSKFSNTRHNIGFMVVESLAKQFHGAWRSANHDLEICEIMIKDQKILLLKPQTFMNASGLVISYLTKKGIKPENILVVHDELEIAFGRVTMRQGGSARGHNGLRSIIEACGPDFWRMRMGIGRPTDSTTVADFVLQNFSEDSELVSQMIELAIKQIIN